MKKLMIKLLVLSGMLLGLPLTGILISGRRLANYTAFPPETQYVVHAPFSWVVFSGYSLFIVSIVFLLMLPLVLRRQTARFEQQIDRPFPWWGWVSLAALLAAWITAWGRFPFFRLVQPHTFTPLWVSFIFLLNAWSYRRTGRCLLINRTGRFAAMFPLSAAFWWFFEYLNRFVQNWYYVGVKFGPLEYFIYATLSFSTVLPAVLSMRELLHSFGWVHRCYIAWPGAAIKNPKPLAWCVLVLSGAGLACIGVLSDYLFPLLWVSPLLIVVCLNVVQGERHIFSSIPSGNWVPVVLPCFAAFLCGIFWEMWNYFSLAKWEYSVPFVHRFQVFEMPLLGYAGYLPFGLECSVMVGLLDDLLKKQVR